MVGLAQLAGDIQAQAGAVVAGGEEGLEQVVLRLFRDAGAIVFVFN